MSIVRLFVPSLTDDSVSTPPPANQHTITHNRPADGTAPVVVSAMLVALVLLAAVPIETGLEIANGQPPHVEQIPTHGGSLRVYLCRADAAHAVSAAVTALLAHERRIGLEDIGQYEQFTSRVHRTKRELLSFLIESKHKGARIRGYGGPGEGNPLLNY